MKQSQQKTLHMKILTEQSPELTRASELYHAAFPEYERKPFQMVLDGQKEGKMIAYSVFMDEDYAGLAFLIPGRAVDVLDYLAVEPSMRGQNIGSRILHWLNEHTCHPFAVEIESTKHPDAVPEDFRRKSFYLSNGLYDCREEIELFGVQMELMSSRNPISFDEYYETMKAYFDDPQEEWISRKIFQVSDRTSSEAV